MQIRTYLKILVKRFWIVLIGVIAVLAATYIFTIRQDRIYQSKATYILSPRTGINQIEDDFVRALEMVSRRIEINTTFAEVASSKLIKNEALAEVDYSKDVIANLSTSALVMGGTNILEITVEAPSPEIAQEYCNLIGEKTQDYVRELYDVFELRLLDSASFRANPIRPSLGLNLILGGILGFGLGASAAFVVEFLTSPYSDPSTFNILDRGTGTYNKAYLVHRLRQEISRAKRHEYPIALGFIQIDVEGEGITDVNKSESMRLFKVLIESEMREDDIVASIDKNTFAFIYPYTSTQNARSILDNFGKRFESMAHDVISKNGDIYFNSFSTVVGYTGSEKSETDLIDRGLRALRTKQL